ncbi:hypothetical protein [Streptomyces inhibens]|uniref:hypothetical protein n=1 Tax=Streptomyces inhibens TaxID=2293571 RepID=UPI001FD4B74A|nr:hypothetical protein [Streptomyces inhibens]
MRSDPPGPGRDLPQARRMQPPLVGDAPQGLGDLPALAHVGAGGHRPLGRRGPPISRSSPWAYC